METVLYQSPAGSPLQFRVVSRRPIEQANFKASEWNTIMRAALQAAGDFWIEGYLPLRFQQYARAMGIYQGKKRKGLPLVKTGNLFDTVGHTASAEATATGTLAQVLLKIPTGNVPNQEGTKGHAFMAYKSNPVVENTLATITTDELERMGWVVSAVLTEAIDGADVRQIRGKIQIWSADENGTVTTTRAAPRVAATLISNQKASLSHIQQRRSPMSLRQLQADRLVGKGS